MNLVFVGFAPILAKFWWVGWSLWEWDGGREGLGSGQRWAPTRGPPPPPPPPPTLGPLCLQICHSSYPRAWGRRGQCLTGRRRGSTHRSLSPLSGGAIFKEEKKLIKKEKVDDAGIWGGKKDQLTQSKWNCNVQNVQNVQNFLHELSNGHLYI